MQSGCALMLLFWRGYLTRIKADLLNALLLLVIFVGAWATCATKACSWDFMVLSWDSELAVDVRLSVRWVHGYDTSIISLQLEVPDFQHRAVRDCGSLECVVSLVIVRVSLYDFAPHYSATADGGVPLHN